MSDKCPLCELDLSKEKVFYRDDFFVIVRTKDLKGHKERIMIASMTHVRLPAMSNEVDVAVSILERVGRQVFKHEPKFIIMDSTFATIKQHWHLVATDLNPDSGDFDQILSTRWLKVVDTNL